MTEHDQRLIHSSDDPNWRTPRDCYDVLSREFCVVVDLAADRENRVTRCWFGPGSPDGEDALARDWPLIGYDGAGCQLPCPVAGFLNPPFSRTLAAAYRTGRIKQGGAWVPHEQNVTKAGWYEIENWARKCWEESQRGCTIVSIFPFAPQTEWYRSWVYGHQPCADGTVTWRGHAALQERRLPHRISFLRADGSPASNAGVNSTIIVWGPGTGIVGPWQPHSFYWSYR